MGLRDQTFEQLYQELSANLRGLTAEFNASAEAVTEAYRNEAQAKQALIQAQAAKETAETQVFVSLVAEYKDRGEKQPSLEVLRTETKSRCITHIKAVADLEAEVEMAIALRRAAESLDERVQTKSRVLRAGSLVLAAKAAHRSPITADGIMDELFQGLDQ